MIIPVDPPQDRVRELFVCVPERGALFWRMGPRRGKLAGSPGDGLDHRYRRVWVDGRLHKVHRIIWVYVHGSAPPMLDHRDGDYANDAIWNLRECTPSQNIANVGRRKNNKTGYKGVSWCSRDHKYTAFIRINGRSIFIGRFDDPISAHQAYMEKAVEVHGEFARAR